MIVISKRRIKIILSCIIISLLAFSFKIAGSNNINTNQSSNTIEEKSIETVSTPVSGKTVVVDAGHGVPDEGAESSNRYDRGRNKFKNCIKITEFIRNQW